jgi:hypothetical protein
MTTDKIRDAYKKLRESTSTSPSGNHLGHEKAILCQTSPNSNDPLDENSLAYRMFSIKTRILNLAMLHTIILDRWTMVVNAMIEKDPGNPILERFRVIHIIPADWNLLMGIIFGKRMCQQGEKLNQFGEEQSGARKHHDCQDVQQIKHILYSIIRLTHANGSTFDNDAKSCYDRIVMLVPAIIAQRLGVPEYVCRTFLEVLAHTKYYTKTIFGVSKAFHCTTADSTIHGPGQGSRAAPAIWTLISCYILALMAQKSQGFTVCDPEETIIHHQSSTGLVDDITHWNINLKTACAILSRCTTSLTLQRLPHSGGKISFIPPVAHWN